MPTAPLPSFLSVIELYEETHTWPPHSLFEKVHDNFSNPVSPLALQKCLDMTDHLSFIRYIPEDTIKLRWFLVQLNHHETEILKVYSLRTGYSRVTFLSRHHVDKKLCNYVAHWWPEWYEYYLDDSNIPVSDVRMLFSQKLKPNLTKYMLWTNSAHLTYTSCFLHWSFNFDS